MAGLIFLWQNIPSTTTYTDIDVTPVLLIDNDCPVEWVDTTDAVLQDTTTTYNSATTTFSDASQVYGGVNTRANITGPILGYADILLPQIFVTDADNVFTDTSTTYNDPSVEYSSSSQVYGGLDRQGDSPPEFINWKDVKPSFKV